MKENNTTPTASTEWPGAFGAFKISREAIRYNLNTVLVLSLILVGGGIALSVGLEMLFGKRFADTFGQIISLLFSTYFSVALTYAYLCSVRHKKVDLQATFAIVPPLFWNMLFLSLLTMLAVIGGLILLIVPGVIIALRLSLASYYLVDRNLGVMEAYKASWHATKGHLGKLWGIIGVGLLMVLPVITIVGAVATVYLLFMYSAVGALLYLHLTKKAAHKQ
jgi:hypothetical protein